MKDLIDLETKKFEKYREDRWEFNVRNIREYRPEVELNNPLFVEYRAITLWYYLSKKYNNLLVMKCDNFNRETET
jgi:hypothetical protein